MPLNIKGNIIDTNDITNRGVFKTRVNNELICYLDSGNLDSYPGTGTVWYDLSGKGYNFNLSGVTFSSGAMVFNGSSNYAKSSSTIDLTSYSHVAVEVYVKAATTGAGFVFEHTADWNTNTGGFGLILNHNGSTPTVNTHHTNHNTEAFLNYNYTIGTNWNSHVNIYCKIADYGRLVNVNNIYLSGTTTVAGSFANSYMYLGARGGTTLFLNGQISIIRIYGKKINSYEISENFQANRVRFSI